ncbi:Protein FAR-RED IMPAIRED RESPONSE 1 [Linum grandiflorum]
MGGKPPLTVITDQDGEMAKAIVKVIPEATHRLCLWHLARNGTSDTGNGAFIAGFNKLVEKDCEEDDFNRECNQLVATHGLEDND